MTRRIDVRTIPARETVFAHLNRVTDCIALYRTMKPKVSDESLLQLSLQDVPLEAMLQDVLDIAAEKGIAGWRQTEGESSVYGGFSLTYNPQQRDGLDPHVSSIGAPTNARNESAWSEAVLNEKQKNSYFDTYGFRRRTETSSRGALGRFLDSCSRSLVRSRVGVICGKKVNVDDAEYRSERGWHRDELLVENVRINIPLRSDPAFVLELSDGIPRHLSVGYAYTWDTNKSHRVLCVRKTDKDRIHLVLGFSPWFDYDPSTDAWAANEYFGKIHPLDMVAEGLMIPTVAMRRGVQESSRAAVEERAVEPVFWVDGGKRNTE